MFAYSFPNIEAFCARFYQGRKLSLTPYTYTLTFTNLAASGSAGAQATQNLNIQANADFLFLSLSHLANINGTVASQSVSGKISPYVRILLTDSGSAQPLMNAATALESLSDNGAPERALPYPKWLQGRTSLQVQLTNYASVAYDIDVAFKGVNVQAL